MKTSQEENMMHKMFSHVTNVTSTKSYRPDGVGLNPNASVTQRVVRVRIGVGRVPIRGRCELTYRLVDGHVVWQDTVTDHKLQPMLHVALTTDEHGRLAENTEKRMPRYNSSSDLVHCRPPDLRPQ